MAGHLLDEILKSHPFLAGMGSDQLAVLKGCASERRYQEGEFVTREGQPATELFLVQEGQVAVETRVGKRGSLRLETLCSGDVLGWSWLVEPYQWLFDSRALTPVQVVVFNGACLRNYCQADHQLGYELLLRIARVIEHRLQATRLQLLDIYQPNRT
jgi:CRP/FNR family transcriptional regulator, cyclic AMP receptor protein